MLYKNVLNDKIGTIDLVKDMRKGKLYTVKYQDGSWRRYYETDFNKILKPIEDAKPMPKNVIYVDFIKKCKIA